MGWYDAFRGDTARVNMGATTGGSAAKNFGDAFKDVGTTMIAADAQAGKNKLIEMQLQNEQIKLDEAATKRADTNTQEYAASMTRDAWGKDKLSSLAALDTSASPEATLNATQAIESFYAPTKEMKQEWTAQEKVVQDVNNKAYLADAFTLDPSASKEARQNAADALQQFYKPETAQLAEIEKRFKEQDVVAQTNFNNELREQATNFKTFADFQKSPDYKTLLTNADAVGIEHVIDRFKLSDKDAAALRKTNAEIKHYENADSIAQQELDLKRAKEKREAWEFKNPQAKSKEETIKNTMAVSKSITDYIQDHNPAQKDADGNTNANPARDRMITTLDKYVNYAVDNGMTDLNKAYNYASTRYNKENKVGTYTPQQRTTGKVKADDFIK